MNNYPIKNEEEHRFAVRDEEAARKYEEYKLKDPFPDIPAALLNSRDIKRYVAATGMIHPFHPEPEKDHMKQASYAVKMLGRCILWDDKGKKCDIEIKEKDEFPLRGNSIAFISLEPRFRIPYYIALRFNLKITYIHRGILLGTGPLVDPGFDGKLAIPLHNLTMNDYVLRGGDDLIWFEFTKIHIESTDLERETEGEEKRAPILLKTYTEFRPDKKILDVNDYLHKAYQGKPIRSSLSNIQQIAERAQKKVNFITWGGIISIAALAFSIVFGVFSLIADTTNYIEDTGQKNFQSIMEQKARIKSLEDTVQSLRDEINELQERVTDKEESLPATGEEKKDLDSKASKKDVK